MKLALSLVLAALLAVAAFGQNSPTNAPQFTFTENFFGSSVYGQQQAVGAAVTTQFTTNSQLRIDQITMPAVGYTGELFGPQYNLCGISAIENLLASTSFNCGNLSIYANGELGYGRIQQNGNPASHGVAWTVDASVNYTLSSHMAVNLFQIGYCDMGVNQTGQSRAGWCGQSGISFLLGSNTAATDAKILRMKHSSEKKAAKHLRSLCKAGDQGACSIVKKS
jgi:hypothetical protein